MTSRRCPIPNARRRRSDRRRRCSYSPVLVDLRAAPESTAVGRHSRDRRPQRRESARAPVRAARARPPRFRTQRRFGWRRSEAPWLRVTPLPRAGAAAQPGGWIRASRTVRTVRADHGGHAGPRDRDGPRAGSSSTRDLRGGPAVRRRHRGRLPPVAARTSSGPIPWWTGSRRRSRMSRPSGSSSSRAGSVGRRRHDDCALRTSSVGRC